MAQIPISISSGTLQEQNLIVGIDLGTTNSLLAKMQDGKPVTVADIGRTALLPSVVHMGEHGPLEVGEDALPYLTQDPARTVVSVKRLMGRSYQQLQDHLSFFSYPLQEDSTESLVRIPVGGKAYTPIEISSFILKELKLRAEHKLKQPVNQAVITVPAYFNDAQRQATRDAGRLAGLEVLRIVNEPTAAALAYGLGLNKEKEITCVVYDLGGGTFDVTVLHIAQGTFEVAATNGDTYLGGDDIDRLVLAHWQEKYQLGELTPTERQQLRLAAEASKRALSEQATTQHQFQLGAKQLQLALTRAELEQLMQPLVQRTLAACQAALQGAGLTPAAVDAVVLVGGSTRIPLIRSSLTAMFGKEPYAALNPDEVVALGAAVQADILAGNQADLLLLDVTPLSLGLETLGGLMDVLIPRNTKIPARIGRQYTTSVDGQVNLRISVYQGERELVQDNRKLAEFELRGIPPMPAALPKVEVTFLLDADGILQVQAKELRSGVVQQIVVRPQLGLTDAAVEAMLLESFTNTEADVQARMITQAKQEGGQVLYQSQKFLRNHQALLTPQEIAGLQSHLAKLTEALQQDKQTIEATITALDDYSKPLAERVMNAAVKAAMVGRKL